MTNEDMTTQVPARLLIINRTKMTVERVERGSPRVEEVMNIDYDQIEWALGEYGRCDTRNIAGDEVVVIEDEFVA